MLLEVMAEMPDTGKDAEADFDTGVELLKQLNHSTEFLINKGYHSEAIFAIQQFERIANQVKEISL